MDHHDLIAVAEIEPQTAWTAVDPIEGPFAQIEAVSRLWDELPQVKYLHSVGMPLAGTRPPSRAQMELMASLAERFGCAYVSEHLSVGGTPHENAGFLLPPCQSEAGIAQASKNIRALSSGLGRPIAVETGVSYLPPYKEEIPDGEYVRRVAESSDCGILLDIHNAYCNQRNGRQSIEHFVGSLPRERVWEMHLAGGVEMDGFWLDAHSGAMTADLFAIATEVASALPNLSAVIVEIFPSFIEQDGDRMIGEAMEQAHVVWEASRRTLAAWEPPRPQMATSGSGVARIEDWEAQLTRSVRMRIPVGLGDDLSLAPAMTLYSKLTHSFRASSIARLMPRTMYMLVASGIDVDRLLQTFETDTPAPLYALNEAAAFVAWCSDKGPDVPLLRETMDYEVALATVPVDQLARVITFSGDPRPLFLALTDRTTLPVRLTGAPWEIEITPADEGPAVLSALGS